MSGPRECGDRTNSLDCHSVAWAGFVSCSPLDSILSARARIPQTFWIHWENKISQ